MPLNSVLYKDTLLQQKFTHFTVVGERCSGTNYLDKLFKDNTTLEWIDIGWKHDYFNKYNTDNNTLVVIAVRNIYNYLRSFIQTPWNLPQLYNMEFSDIIREPFKSYDRIETTYLEEWLFRPEEEKEEIMNTSTILEDHTNIIANRNEKFKQYIEHFNKRDNIIIINYDKLMVSQDELEELLSNLSVLKAQSLQKNIYYKDTSQLFKQKVYPDISMEDLDYINSNTNWIQENTLGFTIRPISSSILNVPEYITANMGNEPGFMNKAEYNNAINNNIPPKILYINKEQALTLLSEDYIDIYTNSILFKRMRVYNIWLVDKNPEMYAVGGKFE
jgi:hypothetical protein